MIHHADRVYYVGREERGQFKPVHHDQGLVVVELGKNGRVHHLVWWDDGHIDEVAPNGEAHDHPFLVKPVAKRAPPPAAFVVTDQGRVIRRCKTRPAADRYTRFECLDHPDLETVLEGVAVRVVPAGGLVPPLYARWAYLGPWSPSGPPLR